MKVQADIIWISPVYTKSIRKTGNMEDGSKFRLKNPRVIHHPHDKMATNQTQHPEIFT
jgi:hypothetical protein